MRTGVRVNKVKIGAYVLCSLTAGATGILLAGWLGSAPANPGSGYELRVIAATVIGGRQPSQAAVADRLARWWEPR